MANELVGKYVGVIANHETINVILTLGVLGIVLHFAGEPGACRLTAIDRLHSKAVLPKLLRYRRRREHRVMSSNDRSVEVHAVWSLISGGGLQGSHLGRVHQLQFYEQSGSFSSDDGHC